MAAESVGMSQKKKDRAATIGMIIFFSILAILTVLPIYLLVLASFKPGNFLLQYGLNLNLDIPHLTLDNYKLLFTGKHDYWTWFGNSLILTVITVILTLAISAFVAYGFAAYEFPFKKLLFGLVILTIVIPADALMLPWYTQFRNFDVFGILHLIKGSGINLIGTKAPMYIMTLFGCGFRSGLYIYIFNQFFRGVPKEIEEAASIDGAGPFYTYFRIMLINTMPAILTVSIFSLVWQYNDVFYAKIFAIKNSALMSLRISSLQATIQEIEKIKDPAVAQLYLYAGIIMKIIPIIIIYVLLQKRFIEGVERSGIVG